LASRTRPRRSIGSPAVTPSPASSALVSMAVFTWSRIVPTARGSAPGW
jgi:hypothetical protein